VALRKRPDGSFPPGHAMSSRRLFLSGLLSSRARLRFAAIIILLTLNAARPAAPYRVQRMCSSAAHGLHGAHYWWHH